MNTHAAPTSNGFGTPSWWDVPGVVLDFLGMAVSAVSRRIFRGPMRESWNWKYEILVRLTRVSYNVLAKKGPYRYNRVFEKLQPKIDSGGATIKVSETFGAPGHWFIPEKDNGSVILYLHGGGYVYGSAKTHGKMIGQIACASSSKALALNYRLAPQHPQPAAIEDACTAFRSLVKSGISPKQIIVAGDSAGGGLVVSAFVALRDAGDVLPAAGVCISPWVDLTCSDESFASNSQYDPVTREACLVAASAYLNGSSSRTPEVSPLFADLKGLPPLLIHAGGLEVLRDQACEFAKRAKSAGNEVEIQVYEDMVHVWHLYSGFTPEADKAIGEIGDFIKSKTGHTEERDKRVQ
jgi:monoterpene epsilon-lactone hydrolase